MRFQNLLLPVTATATASALAGTAQYKILNAASVNSNTPFPDAFVSYSIEFSSFPDFAGQWINT